jgi:hypothetical protein
MTYSRCLEDERKKAKKKRKLVVVSMYKGVRVHL